MVEVCLLSKHPVAAEKRERRGHRDNCVLEKFEFQVLREADGDICIFRALEMTADCDDEGEDGSQSVAPESVK